MESLSRPSCYVIPKLNIKEYFYRSLINTLNTSRNLGRPSNALSNKNSHFKASKSHRLKEKKSMLEKIKKTKKATTRILASLALPLLVINSGIQLITTIVNFGVAHQQAKIDSFKSAKLKRLFDFKSKVDTIKRGTCLTLMTVNNQFLNIFDWLRIQIFYERTVAIMK